MSRFGAEKRRQGVTEKGLERKRVEEGGCCEEEASREGGGGWERKGQWFRVVRKDNLFYLANVQSNAPAARDRMVRGAAG